LRESDLADSQSAIARTGVVYLSRLPPRLTPQKVRQLLAPFGSPVLRVFLAPESTEEYTRRTKAGGSKRKRFTEGWIEFEDKKVAKWVAENLNAERIGQKKGDFLYDDLWCLKYLPKFKWHHLNEQIGMPLQLFWMLLIFEAYHNASRKEKLRNEITMEKRENEAFVRNAERSKMIQNIQRKKAERGEDIQGVDKVRRQFQQKKVVDTARKETEPCSVLKRLFE
jgi:ESF2/ABP1 family protein